MCASGNCSTTAGLSGDIVRAIFEDREGMIWLGTAGAGLNRLKDGRLTTFGAANGLPTEFVVSSHEESDGTMWFGTNGGGLCRYRGGRFTVYTTRQGLFDDTINRLTGVTR